MSEEHLSPAGHRRPRLRMKYSGADWLRTNLFYSKKPRTLSPFGEAVADLLGFCWAGLYHLPAELERVQWESDRCMTLTIRDELATWDFNTLTKLVVVGHDLGIRVSVAPSSNRTLKLLFHARHGQYSFDQREGFATRQPALDDHVRALRSGYEVVSRDAVEAQKAEEP